MAHFHLSAVEAIGAGAAPQLVLTGPGGIDLKVTTGLPSDYANGTGLLLNPSDHTTYVLFTTPPHPGTYHLTTLPGSAAIRWVNFSRPLPPAAVSVRVTPARCQERLRWRIAPQPGQSVVLIDRGASSQHTLATTDSAAGTLTFTPDPGAGGPRSIIAAVNELGTPRAELTVARYTAPTGSGPITGLRARRRSKTTIAATWNPVCAASSTTSRSAAALRSRSRAPLAPRS